MKNLILLILSEDSKVSSMRLMAISSLAMGAGIAVTGLVKGLDPVGLSALCTVFVAAAFGGKVGQKIVEAKAAKDD